MNSNFCVVLGCRNSAISANRPKYACKFFNFPLERKDLTEVWLRKLNLNGWTPGSESLVCDEHFSLDSFQITNNAKVLKSDAVPTVVDELDGIISQYELLLRNQQEEFSSHASEGEKLRCRLCTAFISLEDAVDVYSDGENVMMKILKCIPILACIEKQDHLPKYICRLCHSDLNNSYRLLIRAIEAENFFNRLLTNELMSSDEILMCETVGQRMETTDFVVNKDILSSSDVSGRIPNQSMSDKELHLIGSSLRDPINSFLDPDPFEDNRVIVQIDNINSCSEDDHSVGFDLCTENGKSSSKYPQDISKYNESIMESDVCLLFTCQHCRTTYESKEILDKHLETHIIPLWCEDNQVGEEHKENTQILVNFCKICTTSFPSQDLLMQHSKGVHELKYVGGEIIPEYKCRECDKKFTNKLSLTIHERVHTGARPYVCENCGRCFRSGANLHQHLLIHTGEKKYKCTMCDKAFVRKGALDVHTRVHTGEKPYQCDICRIKYSQKGDLRRHERKHHEGSSEGRFRRGRKTKP